MSFPSNYLGLGGLPITEFYRDQNGEGLIGTLSTDGQLNLISTNDAAFRKFILKSLYQKNRIVPEEADVDDLARTAEALCELEGTNVELSNRVAMVEENKIWVDGINTVYQVTPEGWSTVNVDRPVFRRYPEMLPMSPPIPGGNIDEIFRFVNIKDPLDRILFLTHLIFAFVPNLPHPILAVYGPQGSSKTTAMNLYIQLTDPNVISDVHSYSDLEFQLASIHRWVLGLDNLSGLSQKQSDLLCKLVTGAGFTRRKLYTTAEMMTQKFNRVIIVNGISLPVDRPDLMDRSILVVLDRIDNAVRKDEATLKAEFKEAQGNILGGCFDVLSKAMAIYPTVPKYYNTRMVDYARWGCAIALALGYSQEQFIEALERNTNRQHEESLDASPVATVLNHIFTKTGSLGFCGTASDMTKALKKQAENAGIEPRLLPFSPRMLGKKLAEIKPNLEADGYYVHFSRSKERVWTIVPSPGLKKDFRSNPTTQATLTTYLGKGFSYNPKLSDGDL